MSSPQESRIHLKSAEQAKQASKLHRKVAPPVPPKRADPSVHADPALFHELCEEPEFIFGEDIDALGVTHAGMVDHPDLTRKTRTTRGKTTQARLVGPTADDLHWDDKPMHEVVEEPQFIFGDDIDALGVEHAGGD
ncbi:hypothetical protein VE02_09985 [Pseudogymnoascus sp. 03VT05]|nr:hypothetical protein VE02_09985 [Pseudogymnoascus sp. 03VT05]